MITLILWGNDGIVGKTLGTDIGQGKLTLPLIRVLQTASPASRQRVLKILEGSAEARLDAIRPVLDQSDAGAYTLGVAQRFQQQAVDALDVLPQSEARDSLAAIARFAVDRRF